MTHAEDEMKKERDDRGTMGDQGSNDGGMGDKGGNMDEDKDQGGGMGDSGSMEDDSPMGTPTRI